MDIHDNKKKKATKYALSRNRDINSSDNYYKSSYGK